LLTSIIFGGLILGYNANTLPLTILNCRHTDLASGLYGALKTSTNDYRNFMTAAEIKLLASYIENQIQNTPEQIKMGLYSSCSINYNNQDFQFPDDIDFMDSAYKLVPLDINQLNITIKCFPRSENTAFDYRGDLSRIGLNIILSYAYNAVFQNDQTQNQISNSNFEYVSDTGYRDLLKARGRALDNYIALVATTVAIEVVMFLGSFIYYSLRGNEMDDSKVPIIIKNIFAVLGAAVLLITFSAFILIVCEVTAVQDDVEFELSTYGIYLKYGVKFMIISVFWVIFAFICFALWSGPVWCNRSMKSNTIKNDQIPLSMEAYEYNYDYVDEVNNNAYDEDIDNSSSFTSANPFRDDKSTIIGKNKFEDFKEYTRTSSTDSDETQQEMRKNNHLISTEHEIEMDQLLNPFNQKYAIISTNIALNPMTEKEGNLNHDSKTSLKSKQLSNKRKPPTVKLSEPSLTNQGLILMSPILNPFFQLKPASITPNIDTVQENNQDHSRNVKEKDI
jgi:hypothetical protein